MNRNIDFGAVYFRKTIPPKEDWERDYKVAAEDGHTLFRHWFCWNAIETAPGVFDWEDYDRQLDLAAVNNIKTVIAEMLVDSPEWLYAKYPYARVEKADGTRRRSEMHGSCATGGHYCMCLDNPEVAEAAEGFLTELVNRYREHPGFFGIDIWNENTFYSPERLCFCPATQERFRAWLKDKYADIRSLGKAWYRYSYTDWSQVELPRSFGPYPEVFDAIAFWNDNAFHWMKWRADIIRKLDPKHPVIAHGNARSFNDIAPCCGDDFRGAGIADIYGYTYYYGIACHPLLAGDLIRSASGGKEFWRAEAIGNSTWQDRKAGKPPMLEKDRMADPDNIRLDCLISLAAGAQGYINPRWRPLLDGPLFGAFGWYGMDGSRTERSQRAAELAKWCNDGTKADLWTARPVRGEAAILLLEEAQSMGFILNGVQDYYAHYYSLCVQGIYEALLDSNIQCDFVKIDGIDRYDLLYVPYPLAIPDEKLDRLRKWVEKGGTLITEGCFGYFTGHGHALTTQPSRGFDEVFGCREKTVSFGPDLWEELAFTTKTGIVSGGLYRQSYEVTSGTVCGWYEDGTAAGVDNAYGRGRVRITGTMPGYAYKRRPAEGTRQWVASGLDYAGKKQWITCGTKGIIARFWENGAAGYIWVINQNTVAVESVLEPDPCRICLKELQLVRGPEAPRVDGNRIQITVPEREAVIIKVGCLYR